MGRKILKGILWFLVGIMGLLLLVSILVYLPPVQKFIKNKASSIVSESTGMQLSIDRFRLRFPLSLSIDNTILITPQGDTMLRAGQIRADVALWPLLGGKIQVRQLGLQDAGVHYADTLSAMILKATLDEFVLKTASIRLSDSRVQIGSAGLTRADVELWMGEGHVPDTVNVDTIPALWNIGLDRLDLEQVGFRMRTSPTVTELTVDLPSGRIDDVGFDLGKQDVRVGLIRLDRGQYAYLTDTTTVVPAPVVLESDQAEATPMAWKIRLDRLELDENAFQYGILNGEPQPGFDFNHIQLADINVDIRDVYYRADAMGASIRALAARERSGLEITRTTGEFTMDSVRIVLKDFDLQTPNSSLSAQAEVAAGLLEQDPNAPLTATLQAALSPFDLYYFMTPDPALRQTLSGQTVRVNGDFAGTLSQLKINTLTANMPGHIDFRADGQVANLLDTDHLGGNLRLNGTFTNLGFIRPMLPDSLRNRLGFPARMTLGGSVAVNGNTYAPDIRLSADSGALALKGQLNLSREVYDANLTVTDFPLYTFLPQDSLGLVSLNLTAKGNGFDPRKEGAAADVDFLLGRFDFKEYTYHDITLNAALADHQLEGRLASGTDAAKFGFDLTGELSPEIYAARLTGKVDTLDLQRMGFMREPFQASLLLDADLSFRPDTAYQANIAIDSIRWRHGFKTDYIARTTLEASAGSRGMVAALRSGDLSLDFNSPESIDSLLGGFTTAVNLITAQVDSANINMTPIQEALPEFTLTATAQRENILHALMSAQGLDYRQIDARVTTVNENPLRLAFLVNSLKTGNLTLDTLNLGFWRKDEQLNYFVRLANRPGNIEQMALIALAGNIQGNEAELRVFQRDRSDSVGFRFGVDAELLDSAVRVHMTSEKPIFGYIPWTVNDDNYLVYHFDQRLEADLRLNGPTDRQHFYILSSPLEPSMPTGAIKLDMQGIDIGDILSLLPSAPEIDGLLRSDFGIGFDRGQIVGAGTLGVDSLTYAQKRVGDIGLDVDFQSDSLQRFMLKAEATVDRQTVLQASGTYLTGGDGSVSFRATIPSLPLAVANPFLPEDMAQLSGTLSGWMALSGSTGNPIVNGQLGFADGKFSVPMIGTTYGLGANPLKIDGNILDLNGFGLVSPNNESFIVDGTVDFRDFSRMVTDLSLKTNNFNVISSSRSGGSQIYGQAPIDVDITAKGRVDALTIRGDVALRRTTNVTYTMRDELGDVESAEQHIVRFVDFNDPETYLAADSTANLKVFGMDMLVNINIEDGVSATVNISEDGSNRAEVSGGGNLTYVMNTQGDSRFMGRFDVASGRIIYHPPVISEKDFSIRDGSYVEWTGELVNPSFDITAVETVRTTVQFSGGNTETVDFEISILVRNTLENMDVVFDLAAPNNAVLVNELGQMTQEQRSQQAMALLAYNTYTGPSATAKVDTGNPLNAFISRELNQWARNNLKGVEVSVGIDEVEGDDGTHTNYSYQVSKSFANDRVKVTVGGSVDPNASANQNMSNDFVQDVSVEYRLTERDNMYLKAYRYNTESMLEGEVIETGGGFLMRKKLNKLGDLFKLAPKEDRRRAREMRRELRQDRRQQDEEELSQPAAEDQKPTEPVAEEPKSGASPAEESK